MVSRCKGRIGPNIHGWPLILISVLLSGWVADQPILMFTTCMLGGCFLLWFGIDCFRIEPPDSAIGQQEVTGSFSRGVIRNLLNPNVYVFWFLIGGPLMASAADEESMAPVAYALSFLVTIIMVRDGHSPNFRQDTWLHVAKCVQNCIGNLRFGDDWILCRFPLSGLFIVPGRHFSPEFDARPMATSQNRLPLPTTP